ncbi:hypothetical protein L3Q82_013607, partial [Scortum barcoo]
MCREKKERQQGNQQRREKEGETGRVGSLEDLYTVRDSRGRPDRATFENRLATTAGVRWVQRQHSHYRDKRAPVTRLDDSTTH